MGDLNDASQLATRLASMNVKLKIELLKENDTSVQKLEFNDIMMEDKVEEFDIECTVIRDGEKNRKFFLNGLLDVMTIKDLKLKVIHKFFCV